MRGLSSGMSLLLDLCTTHDIIAVQEHWLDDVHMCKLGNINKDFTYFGVSGMTECYNAGIHKGRPFGGVAFLWRTAFTKNISIIKSDANGSCAAILLSYGTKQILLVNVYFPCHSLTAEYKNAIINCIGCIESIVNTTQHTDVLIIGDTNFACNLCNPGYALFSEFMNDYNLISCDDLSNYEATYCNDALKHYSCIDHIFASDKARSMINSVCIINSPINNSDHKPISWVLEFTYESSCQSAKANLANNKSNKLFKVRWDKADLSHYYSTSYNLLSKIEFNHSIAKCDDNCKCAEHFKCIDKLYNDIVGALQRAERITIPRVPQNSLKPFWNEQLDELKEKSVFWGRMWTNAGRPRSGELFKIKVNCSLKYKMAIRQALYDFDHSFDDELYDHFVSKEPKQFWKCWNKKFRRGVASSKPTYINGLDNDDKIAAEFAKTFSAVYYNSYDDKDSMDKFREACNAHTPPEGKQNNFDITVELLDKYIRQLKTGKAQGPDGLSAEHLQYAHPKIVMLLTSLFQAIAIHQFVPTDFGKGLIIPLIKDKCGDISSTNNYRGITLIPVVTKLFEHILLYNCEPYLHTEDTQFGFKRGLGCSNAIFVLRNTIDYFTERGSTVYTAALDISKAYDSVHHVKLFLSLLDTGLPHWIVKILVDWYSKLFVSVRWNGSISQGFKVNSGVRQGSVISPVLFNVFINKLIVDLRELGHGCFVNRIWFGCLMYADDAILLSTSIVALQIMLNKSVHIIKSLNLQFNSAKSVCIAFGRNSRGTMPTMHLDNDDLHWSNSVKYLGITFNNGLRMHCNTDTICRKFYAASNCIFSNCKGMDELMQLHLQQTYCLPVLNYGLAAVRLSPNQLKSLNVCWNNVYRKIFKYNQWESVNQIIIGFGYLNFTYMWYVSVIKLIRSMLKCTNLAVSTSVLIYCCGTEWQNINTCLNISQKDSLTKSIQFITDLVRDCYHRYALC